MTAAPNVRFPLVLLAVGLGLVWFAAVETHTGGWLAWCDLAAAAASLVGAAVPSRGQRVGLAFSTAIAVALAALGVVGLVLARGAVTLWTLAFALTYALVAVGFHVERAAPQRPRALRLS